MFLPESRSRYYIVNPGVTLYVSFYVTAVMAIIGVIIYGAHHADGTELGYSFVFTILGALGIAVAGGLSVINAISSDSNYAAH